MWKIFSVTLVLKVSPDVFPLRGQIERNQCEQRSPVSPLLWSGAACLSAGLTRCLCPLLKNHDGDDDTSAEMELLSPLPNNKVSLGVWERDKAEEFNWSQLVSGWAAFVEGLIITNTRVKKKKMKLLKPSWVSHNGKILQESEEPSWAFVVGGRVE